MELEWDPRKAARKNAEPELEDDLQPEYDLRTLLKGGVQGKYAERYKAGTNLGLLAPGMPKVKLQNAARASRR